MEMDKTSKLKQEIEEYLTKDYCCEFKEECKDGVRIRCSEYEAKLYLILRFAEPREKRIAELEKRCANYEMTISKMEKGTCDICKETEKDKRITELEMTVGTLRTFSNEQATCIEELEKACEETQELLDKQIEATYKLDKENAELKHQLTHRNCLDCSNHSSKLRMRNLDLEKENAELKKDKKELCHSISEGGKACVYLNGQLTKAKEIIKKLLSAYTSYADSFDDRDNEIVTEAEQFLNSEPQSKWINPARTTNDNEIEIK